LLDCPFREDGQANSFSDDEKVELVQSFFTANAPDRATILHKVDATNKAKDPN